MMKYISGSRPGVLLILLFFFSTTVPLAWSQEKERASSVSLRAKEIVEAVHAYILEHSDDMVAVQQSLQNDSRFHDHDKGLYIFMHCYNAENNEAICCGQGIRPELVGKNMWPLRTPNGRLLFHEMAQMVERDGGGWMEYEWLNPYRKRIQTKRSYVKGVVLKDGRKCWVGCGFWKE
jgi:signal transduction histidine kinase